MKKILAILIPVFAFLLCLSCEHHEQMGFPKSVYFSKEGGEQVISGNNRLTRVQFENISFPELSYEMLDSVNMTIATHYRWISITHTYGSSDFHIKVAPNTTGKKRKVILNPYNDPDYAIIKVEQGR